MSVVIPVLVEGETEDMVYDRMIGALHHGYAQVPPRDRRDAIVIIHPQMRDALLRSVLAIMTTYREPLVKLPDPLTRLTAGPDIETLFGMPVEVSPEGDWRHIEIRAENTYDRALRRAQERGQVVNVMAPIPLPIEYPPAPKPTLRALVRHWMKRVRRG